MEDELLPISGCAQTNIFICIGVDFAGGKIVVSNHNLLHQPISSGDFK
jgi:hypothetical protein